MLTFRVKDYVNMMGLCSFLVSDKLTVEKLWNAQSGLQFQKNVEVILHKMLHT